MVSRENPCATKKEREVFETFLKELQVAGRREKTLKSYLSDWVSFSRWFHEVNGERFDVARLTAMDVNDYRDGSIDKKLSPATVNRRIVFLKRYATHAWGEGLIKKRVYEEIKRVGYVKRQTLAPRSLDKKQVRAYLREVELRADVRDAAVIYLLLFTGLRVGELVGLTMDDVRLSSNRGTLTVRATAKGLRERVVPVPLEARKRLQRYLEQRGDQGEEVFLGQRGPIKEDAVVRVVKKYAKFAGLDISPHRLRHTFAYNYLEKTQNDLVGLANILGHQSVDTTQIYTQKRLEDLKENVEKVGYY